MFQQTVKTALIGSFGSLNYEIQIGREKLPTPERSNSMTNICLTQHKSCNFNIVVQDLQPYIHLTLTVISIVFLSKRKLISTQFWHYFIVSSPITTNSSTKPTPEQTKYIELLGCNHKLVRSSVCNLICLRQLVSHKNLSQGKILVCCFIVDGVLWILHHKLH